MAAPYELTGTCTDDESFDFGLFLYAEDGSPFPWADYSAFQYELNGDCGPSLTLGLGTGITIDEPTHFIRFQAAVSYRLAAGQYVHGFRVVDAVTGAVTQIFDGTVTVSEGNFR